jgi:hypothetical protein
MDMGTICQACGYERKPTDQVPDWECPACGKAYVKTAHDPHGALSGLAPSYSSEPDNRLDERPAYQQMPTGPAFNKPWQTNKYQLVLGGIFALLLIWGVPILSNPSAASAILFHGDAVFMFGLVLIVCGIVLVARYLRANVDANNPSSRFAFYSKLLALSCAAFFVLPTLWLRNQEHTELRIQANGQRVMADVVRIYRGSCGKHSCSINVEYAFTPTSEPEGSPPVHGYARLGTTSNPNNTELVYARTTQHVPIAYEVDRPQVSALNFNDDIFRLDHSESYHRMVGLLAKISLGIFLIGLAISWFSVGSKSGNP